MAHISCCSFSSNSRCFLYEMRRSCKSQSLIRSCFQPFEFRSSLAEEGARTRAWSFFVSVSVIRNRVSCGYLRVFRLSTSCNVVSGVIVSVLSAVPAILTPIAESENRRSNFRSFCTCRAGHGKVDIPRFHASVPCTGLVVLRWEAACLSNVLVAAFLSRKGVISGFDWSLNTAQWSIMSETLLVHLPRTRRLP
jgi:hypothetical protein